MLGLALNPPSVRPAVAGSRSVTDMSGREVTLNAPARRAAILPPVIAAYLTLAKEPTDLIGASQLALETVAPSALGVLYRNLATVSVVSNGVNLKNPERFLLAHPDVAVIWGEDVGSLARLGFSRSLALRGDPNDPVGVVTELWGMLGVITGSERRAAEILDRWRVERESFGHVTPRREPTPSIVFLYNGPGIGQIGGRYGHLNGAIRLIHARNSADEFARTADSDLEQLLVLDPELILITADYRRSPRELFEDSRWQALRAARTRAIYRIPRLADVDGPVDEPLFCEWLAELVYPTEMPRRWRQQFRDRYREVYRVSPAETLVDAILNTADNADSSGYARFFVSAAKP